MFLFNTATINTKKNFCVVELQWGYYTLLDKWR
jgi:hypothetical protein